MLLDLVAILGVISPVVRPRHTSSALDCASLPLLFPFPGKSLTFTFLLSTHSFFPSGAGRSPLDSVSVLSSLRSPYVVYAVEVVVQSYSVWVLMRPHPPSGWRPWCCGVLHAPTLKSG